MISIRRANENDNKLLADIGKTTFIESHGNSASPKDINSYIDKNLNPQSFKDELIDTNNIYHLIYYNQQPVGFSKIIFNIPNHNTDILNITKLERIYVLKEFYGLKLGFQLLDHNISLSRTKGQSGIWLNVWTKNQRAIDFYKKAGFEIIGSYDFKISENHSNPNHQMLLKF